MAGLELVVLRDLSSILIWLIDLRISVIIGGVICSLLLWNLLSRVLFVWVIVFRCGSFRKL